MRWEGELKSLLAMEGKNISHPHMHSVAAGVPVMYTEKKVLLVGPLCLHTHSLHGQTGD